MEPINFKKGDDYWEDEEAELRTFGISSIDKDKRKFHVNKIEVYGDEELRDLIIVLLNQYHEGGEGE